MPSLHVCMDVQAGGDIAIEITMMMAYVNTRAEVEVEEEEEWKTTRRVPPAGRC